MGRMLVFIDTTALTSAPRLASAAWEPVMAAVRDGRVVAAVSDVSLGEVDRQARRKQEHIGRDASTWLGTPPVWSPPSEQAEFAVGVGRWIERVPTGDWPSHEELWRRDIEGRRPFVESGKGYRDALIWHGLLEWMRRTAQSGEPVMLLTNNTTDFAEKVNGGRGVLHQDFVADLREAERVEIVLSPRELGKLIAEQLPAQETADRIREVASLAVSAFVEPYVGAGGPLDEPFMAKLDGGASGAEGELEPVDPGRWRGEWQQQHEQRGWVLVERLRRALEPDEGMYRLYRTLWDQAGTERVTVRVRMRLAGIVEVVETSLGDFKGEVTEKSREIEWIVEHWDPGAAESVDVLTFTPQVPE